jgi:hypothetical protein
MNISELNDLASTGQVQRTPAIVWVTVAHISSDMGRSENRAPRRCMKGYVRKKTSQ